MLQIIDYWHRICLKNKDIENKVVIAKMKTKKCKKCDNETYQEDGICVICKIGITRIYEELVNLLKKDNKWNLQIQKTAEIR